MSKIIQTAGRDGLGDFAPEFAKYNDDVLFGEVWSDETISVRERCIITITALTSKGILDSSLKYHIQNAKNNGISSNEMAAILTHAAFYAGWPNAWAALKMAKEVYGGESSADNKNKGGMFGIGKPNEAFAKYFIGKSYLNPVATEGVPIFNVTFEPKCRNNWHIHKASEGGGQILLCVSGNGWYQEWGKAPRALKEGDCVVIPAGVKHWHGATKDGWFSHLAVEVSGKDCSIEWCEPVTDEQYNKLS